ncbi:hypothetical protein BJ742DRAFT_352861 [Cladochytrium replicatum]|nr:hypothetical protein BJ742DRAFT_352861 [Cladochytrium replicatum]
MYRREMDRARQWEKDLEDELAAVVDRTETEMRETVCKHEQRQAELARNLYEMNLKLAVLTDERDAALAELNEERENGKFALATMSSERERLQRELAISIEEYVREREGLRRQLSKNSEDAQTRETELLEHHRLAIADLKSKLESQAARKLKEETERFNSEAARQLTQQRKELERGHEAAIQSERKSAEERLAKALEREAEKFDTKLKEHLKGQEKDIRKELNAERRIVEREKDVEVDQERRYAREQREAIEREVGLRKELEEKLKAEREQTRKAEAKARELDEAKSELEADLHRLQSKAQRRENALQSENEQISATCRDLEEKIKQLRVELRVLRSQAAEVPNQSIPTMVTAIQRSRSPVNDDVRRAHVLPFPEEPHLDEPTSEPEQSFRKLPSNPRKKDANGQKAQSASTAAPKKTQSRKKKVESAENDNQGDAGEEEEIELAATSEEHTKAIGKRADAEEAVGRTDESRRKKTKQNGSKSDQAAAKAAQTRPAQSNKRKAVEVESEDERVARDDDEIEVSDDDDERAVRRPKRAARKNGEERRRAAPNSPSTQDDVRAEGPTHIDASEKEKIQKKKKDAQKKGLPRAEEAPANECYGDQAPVDIPSKRKAAEAKKPRAPAKSLAKKFAREDQENQQQADPDRTDDESDAEIGRSGPSRAEDPSVILETQREQVVEETQVEEYAPITAVSRRTNGRVVQETENGGERSIEKRKKNEGSKNLPVRDENEGDEGFEDAGVKKKAPVRKAKAKVPELAESDGEAENAPRVIKAKPKATKSTRGKAPEARSRVVAREQGGSDGANEDGAQATKKRKLNHTFLTKAGAAGRPALDFSSLRAAGIGIQSGPAGGLLQQPPPPSWLGFLQKTKTIPGAANE